jgi:hypothetical protein
LAFKRKKAMPNDNLEALTVQTLSGNLEHQYNIHQTLQHVVDFTVEKLKLALAPGEVWELRLGSTLLDLTKSIAEAGVPDHAVLKLAPHDSGGGARS